MNTGCIPTKALVRSAEIVHYARKVEDFGFRLNGTIETDLPAIVARKDAVTGEIIARMKRGMDSNEHLDIIQGAARLVDATSVAVGDRTLTAPHVILATGSRPARPPIPGLAEAGYVTSDEIMSVTTMPRRMVVIGGGAVALEFAQMFQRFGAAVTVVELLERLLPREDEDISHAVEEFLRGEGLDVVTGARVERVATHGDGHHVAGQKDGTSFELLADLILLATGRVPNIEGLGLDDAGIVYSREGIQVDAQLRTSVPSVFAAGDCTGHPQFTHVAVYEGGIAAENAINGSGYEIDLTAAPRAVFTDPEVASVGLTEAEARSQRLNINVGRHPMSSIGRARVMSDMRGFIKLVAEADGGKLLGAHMVGPHAAELVHAVVLAMNADPGTTDVLLDSIFIHPTLMEGVQSAAEALWSDAAPTMTH